MKSALVGLPSNTPPQQPIEMSSRKEEFKYPRRRVLRYILQKLSIPAFALVSRMEIIGRENLPARGPLLLVGNHFSYIDPVSFVRIARWPIEFLGGADFAHAPGWVGIIPKLWGYYPLYRGTGSTYALKAAEAILSKGGILGIFLSVGLVLAYHKYKWLKRPLVSAQVV